MLFRDNFRNRTHRHQISPQFSVLIPVPHGPCHKKLVSECPGIIKFLAIGIIILIKKGFPDRHNFGKIDSHRILSSLITKYGSVLFHIIKMIKSTAFYRLFQDFFDFLIRFGKLNQSLDRRSLFFRPFDVFLHIGFHRHKL